MPKREYSKLLKDSYDAEFYVEAVGGHVSVSDYSPTAATYSAANLLFTPAQALKTARALTKAAIVALAQDPD